MTPTKKPQRQKPKLPDAKTKPGDRKQKQTTSKPADDDIIFSSQASRESRQRLLDVFERAFHDLLDPNSLEDPLEPKLQRLKQHLYNRDFHAAFGDLAYLRAYAARWSPSRALAYRDIFEAIYRQYLESSQVRDANILCVGGGDGAELVGLSSLLEIIHNNDMEKSSEEPKIRIAATVVDVADWSIVLQQLCESSVNMKTNHIKQGLSYTSIQRNILDAGAFKTAPLQEQAVKADVVTIFFTLNELFSESLPRTQTFLLTLTNAMKKGSLLIVVDSAGSYSTVGFGAKQASAAGSSDDSIKKTDTKATPTRKYPMAWLLDHILLKLAPQAQLSTSVPWMKIHTLESRWFRLSEVLKYPIRLEDMRYQLHVFRRE